jgi:hypothetical protein
LKLQHSETLSNFAFKTNLRRYTLALDNAALKLSKSMVGRCRLTLSKPVLKAPMLSALEARNCNVIKCFQRLVSNSTCAATAWPPGQVAMALQIHAR